MTGFVDYGQQRLDQCFIALKEECMQHRPLKQRSIATHMLTIMIKGIIFKLNFPFAHSATTGKYITTNESSFMHYLPQHNRLHFLRSLKTAYLLVNHKMVFPLRNLQ